MAGVDPEAVKMTKIIRRIEAEVRAAQDILVRNRARFKPALQDDFDGAPPAFQAFWREPTERALANAATLEGVVSVLTSYSSQGVPGAGALLEAVQKYGAQAVATPLVSYLKLTAGLLAAQPTPALAAYMASMKAARPQGNPQPVIPGVGRGYGRGTVVVGGALGSSGSGPLPGASHGVGLVPTSSGGIGPLVASEAVGRTSSAGGAMLSNLGRSASSGSGGGSSNGSRAESGAGASSSRGQPAPSGREGDRGAGVSAGTSGVERRHVRSESLDSVAGSERAGLSVKTGVSGYGQATAGADESSPSRHGRSASASGLSAGPGTPGLSGQALEMAGNPLLARLQLQQGSGGSRGSSLRSSPSSTPYDSPKSLGAAEAADPDGPDLIRSTSSLRAREFAASKNLKVDLKAVEQKARRAADSAKAGAGVGKLAEVKEQREGGGEGGINGHRGEKNGREQAEGGDAGRRQGQPQAPGAGRGTAGVHSRTILSPVSPGSSEGGPSSAERKATGSAGTGADSGAAGAAALAGPSHEGKGGAAADEDADSQFASPTEDFESPCSHFSETSSGLFSVGSSRGGGRSSSRATKRFASELEQAGALRDFNLSPLPASRSAQRLDFVSPPNAASSSGANAEPKMDPGPGPGPGSEPVPVAAPYVSAHTADSRRIASSQSLPLHPGPSQAAAAAPAVAAGVGGHARAEPRAAAPAAAVAAGAAAATAVAAPPESAVRKQPGSLTSKDLRELNEKMAAVIPTNVVSSWLQQASPTPSVGAETPMSPPAEGGSPPSALGHLESQPSLPLGSPSLLTMPGEGSAKKDAYSGQEELEVAREGEGGGGEASNVPPWEEGPGLPSDEQGEGALLYSRGNAMAASDRSVASFRTARSNVSAAASFYSASGDSVAASSQREFLRKGSFRSLASAEDARERADTAVPRDIPRDTSGTGGVVAGMDSTPEARQQESSRQSSEALQKLVVLPGVAVPEGSQGAALDRDDDANVLVKGKEGETGDSGNSREATAAFLKPAQFPALAELRELTAAHAWHSPPSEIMQGHAATAVAGDDATPGEAQQRAELGEQESGQGQRQEEGAGILVQGLQEGRGEGEVGEGKVKEELTVVEDMVRSQLPVVTAGSQQETEADVPLDRENSGSVRVGNSVLPSNGAVQATVADVGRDALPAVQATLAVAPRQQVLGGEEASPDLGGEERSWEALAAAAEAAVSGDAAAASDPAQQLPSTEGMETAVEDVGTHAAATLHPSSPLKALVAEGQLALGDASATTRPALAGSEVPGNVHQQREVLRDAASPLEGGRETGETNRLEAEEEEKVQRGAEGGVGRELAEGPAVGMSLDIVSPKPSSPDLATEQHLPGVGTNHLSKLEVPHKPSLVSQMLAPAAAGGGGEGWQGRGEGGEGSGSGSGSGSGASRMSPREVLQRKAALELSSSSGSSRSRGKFWGGGRGSPKGGDAVGPQVRAGLPTGEVATSHFAKESDSRGEEAPVMHIVSPLDAQRLLSHGGDSSPMRPLRDIAPHSLVGHDEGPDGTVHGGQEIAAALNHDDGNNSGSSKHSRGYAYHEGEDGDTHAAVPPAATAAAAASAAAPAPAPAAAAAPSPVLRGPRKPPPLFVEEASDSSGKEEPAVPAQVLPSSPGWGLTRLTSPREAAQKHLAEAPGGFDAAGASDRGAAARGGEALVAELREEQQQGTAADMPSSNEALTSVLAAAYNVLPADEWGSRTAAPIAAAGAHNGDEGGGGSVPVLSPGGVQGTHEGLPITPGSVAQAIHAFEKSARQVLQAQDVLGRFSAGRRKGGGVEAPAPAAAAAATAGGHGAPAEGSRGGSAQELQVGAAVAAGAVALAKGDDGGEGSTLVEVPAPVPTLERGEEETQVDKREEEGVHQYQQQKHEQQQQLQQEQEEEEEEEDVPVALPPAGLAVAHAAHASREADGDQGGDAAVTTLSAVSPLDDTRAGERGGGDASQPIGSDGVHAYSDSSSRTYFPGVSSMSTLGTTRQSLREGQMEEQEQEKEQGRQGQGQEQGQGPLGVSGSSAKGAPGGILLPELPALQSEEDEEEDEEDVPIAEPNDEGIPVAEPEEDDIPIAEPDDIPIAEYEEDDIPIAEPDDIPIAEPDEEDIPIAKPDDIPLAVPDEEDIPIAEPDDTPLAEPEEENVPIAEPDDIPLAKPDESIPVAEPDDIPLAKPDPIPLAQPVEAASVSGPGRGNWGGKGFDQLVSLQRSHLATFASPSPIRRSSAPGLVRAGGAGGGGAAIPTASPLMQTNRLVTGAVLSRAGPGGGDLTAAVEPVDPRFAAASSPASGAGGGGAGGGINLPGSPVMSGPRVARKGVGVSLAGRSFFEGEPIIRLGGNNSPGLARTGGVQSPGAQQARPGLSRAGGGTLTGPSQAGNEPERRVGSTLGPVLIRTAGGDLTGTAHPRAHQGPLPSSGGEFSPSWRGRGDSTGSPGASAQAPEPRTSPGQSVRPLTPPASSPLGQVASSGTSWKDSPTGQPQPSVGQPSQVQSPALARIRSTNASMSPARPPQSPGGTPRSGVSPELMRSSSLRSLEEIGVRINSGAREILKGMRASSASPTAGGGARPALSRASTMGPGVVGAESLVRFVPAHPDSFSSPHMGPGSAKGAAGGGGAVGGNPLSIDSMQLREAKLRAAQRSVSMPMKRQSSKSLLGRNNSSSKGSDASEGELSPSASSMASSQGWRASRPRRRSPLGLFGCFAGSATFD